MSTTSTYPMIKLNAFKLNVFKIVAQVTANQMIKEALAGQRVHDPTPTRSRSVRNQAPEMTKGPPPEVAALISGPAYGAG
ncbi:hypothetical protein HET69_22690 [Streptomyces sp. CJ_13]|uniref:hypothetical protein n=1 Tax=Streptomyces sp. CJ_13 TaxID=2724943 RepID=UPI001BDC30A3|nr:hypothetical protein [Streptomyces sp. CJ_13]MBT1186729.1 hypothetical protein [Streptomyces sp. CJ_13]